MQTLQDLIDEYTRVLNDAHQTKLEELRNIFEHLEERPPKQWDSLTEMLKDIERVTPKPLDKAARAKEIERELEIIRGRVPTPKGYTVNPSKIKALTKELKSLS